MYTVFINIKIGRVWENHGRAALCGAKFVKIGTTIDGYFNYIKKTHLGYWGTR